MQIFLDGEHTGRAIIAALSLALPSCKGERWFIDEYRGEIGVTLHPIESDTKVTMESAIGLTAELQQYDQEHGWQPRWPVEMRQLKFHPLHPSRKYREITVTIGSISPDSEPVHLDRGTHYSHALLNITQRLNYTLHSHL